MTQQIINLGTNPNDGTGDNLRSGGAKINSNFTELYSDVSAINTEPAISNISDVNSATNPNNADIASTSASWRFLGYDGSDQFRVETVPSSAGILVARGGGAANMPSLQSQGVNLFLNPNTPATQTIVVNSGSSYTIMCGSGGSITVSGAITGTVTSVTPLIASATTTSLTVTVTSNPTPVQVYQNDMNLSVGAAGLGDLYFGNGTGTILVIKDPGSASNNYVLVTSGTYGVSPVISAAGGDANMDLGLSGNGTGVLKFGTYTASAINITADMTTLPITGYISTKDSGGTSRKMYTS